MNVIGSVLDPVLIVFGIIYFFIKLVHLARKGNREIAVATVLLFGAAFVPYANMETQLKVMQEDKSDKGSEDGTGDPTDPEKVTR